MRKWLFVTICFVVGFFVTLVPSSDIYASDGIVGGSVQHSMMEFNATIKTTDIKDGTAPFDKSNDPGFDQSDSNGLVRTFDTVTIPLKVTINPKGVNSLQNIKLRITGTLENGIVDNRVNASFSVGGEVNIPSKTVAFTQDYTVESTGNSVMIPVAYDVQGALPGVVLTPKLKVQVLSVDGKDVASSKIAVEFNDLPGTEVSAQVNIKPYVASGLAGAGITYWPTSRMTGDTTDMSNTHSFALSFGIDRVPGKSDIRGATFPTGKLRYNIEFTGKVYWDGGPKKGVTETFNFDTRDEPIVLWDQQPIGFASTRAGRENTYFEDKSYTYAYSNSYSAPRSSIANLSDATIKKESYRSVWDSGSWTVDEPVVTSNTVSYDGLNEGYMIGNTFPEYRSDGYTGSKIYGVNDRIFSSNAFILKMANDYRIGGKNNKDKHTNNTYYTATVTLVSYEDDDGTVIPFNKKGTFSSSERNTGSGSYDIQTTLFGYPSYAQIGTPNIGWSEVSKGDVSVIRGSDVAANVSLGSSTVSYGGYDAMVKWNTDAFELTESYAKVAETNVYNLGYYDRSIIQVRNDRINQKVLYGVPLFDDMSFESLTTKHREDYTWYPTWVEANAKGLVGALMSSVSAATGPKWSTTLRVPLDVITTKVGSLSDSGTANIVVSDYYAYLDEERTQETFVTKNKSYGSPAIWSDNGDILSRQVPFGGSVNFETLALTNAQTSSILTANKATYYNSETIDWSVASSMVVGNSGLPDDYDGSVQITQTLPKGLDYKLGSGDVGGVAKDPKVVKNANGTTTLLWELLVQRSSITLPKVTFKTTINPFALSTGVSNGLTITSIISSAVDYRRENLRTSSVTITILKVGMVGIYETIDTDNGERNSQYTVRIKPYTTIEDEFGVTGLTHIPVNLDALGSTFEGSTKLTSASVIGRNDVNMYINTRWIDSAKPNNIDFTKDGWVKVTPGMDLSRAVSVAFRIEGALANTDVVELVLIVQTQNNQFGNVYLNETSINSDSDYKLSPISNRVRYTIRADAELGFDRIQIKTGKSSDGLSVSLRTYKDIVRDRSNNESITIGLYDVSSGAQVAKIVTTIAKLTTETPLVIPSNVLSKNANKLYEARLEGYNDNRIYVPIDATKISTKGYTASERALTLNVDTDGPLSYKGVVMSERERGKDSVELFETLTVSSKSLTGVVSGYGLKMDLTVDYKNEMTVTGFIFPSVTALFDKQSIDDVYSVSGNSRKVSLISTPKVAGAGVTSQYAGSPLQIVKGSGQLVTKPSDIPEGSTVMDAGSSIYTPIWPERLGLFDYTYQFDGPLGVNAVSVKGLGKLELSGTMYSSIDSGTPDRDGLLIVPSTGLASKDGWSEFERSWMTE